MMGRRVIPSAVWTALIVACALVHALVYIQHQRQDWPNDRIFSDQGEFEALGKNLLTHGRFTRYPDASPPITESERMPGYPLMLAAIYAVTGPSRMAVVLVQAVLFAVTCLVISRIGALVWSPRVGVAAGLAAALYPPLPYWSALALTEILATLLTTVAVFYLLRGVRSKSALDFALAGAAFGYLTITRPAWALLAPVLALVLLLVTWGTAERVRLRRLVVMGATMAVIVVPWVGFVYTHFHVVRLNPVALWRTAYWGYWQGVFPGRMAAEIDVVTDSDLEGEALMARLRQIGPDVERMKTYVVESRSITALWRGIPGVHAMTKAKFGIEDASRAIILRHLREGDLGGFLYRRLTYGSFALWASDIPIRYSQINATPVLTIRLMQLTQVLLLMLCAWGVIVTLRTHRVAGAVFLAALVYTELVHVFIHSDIRFSLPVKPLVMLLAVVAVTQLAHVRVFQGAAAVKTAPQRG